MINLLSDTVTLPTPGMLEAMWSAPVGDDVFREDPSVNRLEATAAALFDREAALFCPSGTMANQIALKVHTRPLDEVICDEMSHIYQYEVGGYAYHAGVGIQLLNGKHGILTGTLVEESIRPDFDWLPRSRLVVLENTCNKGGGSIYPMANMESIAEVCRRRGLALHLDGARLFNALVAGGGTPQEIGRIFDSISICLSKGLGAPVGSVLLGSAAFIAEARRTRKAFGGGMRQAGFLAAAGLYALEHHIDRLQEDHAHARHLSDVLSTCTWVADIRPVETNIVLFDLAAGLSVTQFLDYLLKSGVKASAFGPQSVRFVTHLGVDAGMIDRVRSVLHQYDPTTVEKDTKKAS